MSLRYILIILIFSTSKYSLSQEKFRGKQLVPKNSSFKTPKGHIIKYKTEGNYFYIQWMNQNNLRTVSYRFDIKGPDAWLPELIDENENFLVIRAGCGNPCWVGIFLPLKSNNKYQVIHEYLGYDLEKNYAAYLNNDDQLEVLNLKTLLTQVIPTPNCKSAFKGYCITNVHFKKHSINYKWNSGTSVDLKEGKSFTKRLKI